MEEVKEESKEVQQPVQTVEKQEEIKTRDYTDEELLNAVLNNKSVYDKIYEKASDKKISKLLNVDIKNLTEEDRKTEFIPKSKLEEATGKFKNKLIHNELKKDFGEHYEIFKDKVDISKITFEEEEFKGYSEQVEGIKTTFSKYFEVKEEETVLGGLKGKSPKNTNKTSEQLYNENLSKAKQGNRNAYSEAIKNRLNINN